jgi:hypothetical protein
MKNAMHTFQKFGQMAIGAMALGLSGLAHAGMPSSGSCAFLMTLPVPYGASATAMGETGFNFIGKITFTSATTGAFSGRVINPTYQANNSPYILAKNILDFENIPMTIEAMNASNGFTGGYKMVASSKLNGRSIYLEWTAVPNNNGKSILLVSSGVGTPDNPGVGPGSGVCQF